MTNQEILEKAIQKAIDGGWRGDLLNIDVQQQDDGLVRVYWDDTEWSVFDIIFNHAFAKGLWGVDLLSTYGDDFGAIRFFAEQVAFDIQGKLHSIDRKTGQRSYEFLNSPELSLHDYASKAPTDLVEVERFVMQIEDMAAAIPFRTHRITKVESMNGIPAWQYHLQQMVIAENPIEYLEDNI